MNLNQLIYVEEINKMGSFSRAARTLYISQSALSKSIQALELELKQELFLRTAEGVVTTEFGKRFLAESEMTLQHINRIKALALESNKEKEGEVINFRVTTGHLMFAGEIFYKLIHRYMNANIAFHFYQKSDSEVFTDVRDGVTNLGMLTILTSYAEEIGRLFGENDIEYHPLGRVNLGIGMGRNNPVHENGVTQLKKGMLEGQFMITVKENIYPFTKGQEKMIEVFNHPRVVYVSSNDVAVKLCTQMPAFCSVAFCDKIYSDINMAMPLLVYPYKHANLKYEFGWIKKGDTELNPVEESYVREIKDLFQ